MDSRLLFLVEERIKTFKNWPFSDKEKCNVRNMAEAGFYSVATGPEDADSARCFLCGKELDGWEPADDPRAEHRSHAAYCAFVQLDRNEDQLLLSEFLSTAHQCMINDARRRADVDKLQVDTKAKAIRRKLMSIQNNKTLY